MHINKHYLTTTCTSRIELHVYVHKLQYYTREDREGTVQRIWASENIIYFILRMNEVLRSSFELEL